MVFVLLFKNILSFKLNNNQRKTMPVKEGGGGHPQLDSAQPT